MEGKMVFTGPVVVVNVAYTPAPKSGVVVCAGSKSGRNRTESFEVEKTPNTASRKHGGGGSSKVTQSRRAVEFVDKGNGNKVIKEEVKRKYAVKVVDKGRTTEHRAETKITKKVTIHSSDNSSGKTRVAAAPKPSATSKRAIKL